MPNPSLVRRHKGLVRHTAHQFMHVDAARFVVAWLRYQWFVRVRRTVRTIEDGNGVAAQTVFHNLKGLSDLAVARSLYLVRPLSVLEDLAADADVLVIGPRTEGEILALLAHGFDLPHIKAVDLISYSPWIDLADMHALPYPDRSFDVVTAGWVLAYSDDKKRAADEMLRVARPNSVIALGVEWNSRSTDDVEKSIGYLPGSADRLTSVEEVLDLFGSSVGSILARQDVPAQADGAWPLVVVFTVNHQVD